MIYRVEKARYTNCYILCSKVQKKSVVKRELQGYTQRFTRQQFLASSLFPVSGREQSHMMLSGNLENMIFFKQSSLFIHYERNYSTETGCIKILLSRTNIYANSNFITSTYSFLALSQNFYYDPMSLGSFIFKLQKQPPEVFYVKSCSEKLHKIHRKTLVPESLF